MKHKKITLMALAMTMGLALTGCGSKDAASAEDTTVATVEENTVETPAEKTETEAESEVIEEEDPTYASLKSDPYFDWDNAIEDTKGEEYLTSVLSSAEGKQLLYNIVDGDKYVEVSGAEVYEANKTIKMGGKRMYPNLAYYGVDPAAGALETPTNRFICIDTSYTDNVEYMTDAEVTVVKAYTVPIDETNGVRYAIAYDFSYDVDIEQPMLCEIEYNGEHYWTGALKWKDIFDE